MARLPRLGSTILALFVSATVLHVAPTPSAAQELEDVVYLKDGSVIRGIIVEQIPGESILIETRDGNRFRYAMDIIGRMTREPRRATPAAPAAGGESGSTAAAYRSPTTAWGWSFLWPGGGQFYNGQNTKGWVFAGLGLAGAVTALDGAWDCGYWGECAWTTIGMVVYLGSWVASQVDAYRVASANNRRLGGSSLDFGPELVVFQRPGLGSADRSPRARVGLSLVRLSF